MQQMQTARTESNFQMQMYALNSHEKTDAGHEEEICLHFHKNH